MPIAELSIVIGVLTIIFICGGVWLYFRMRLNYPYQGSDPRASSSRMTYEPLNSSIASRLAL